MNMTVIDETPGADRVKRSAEANTSTPAKTKVWDIAVRMFHWSLVVSYAIAWLSADEWDQLHEIAGYVIAGLIGFRLIWGVIGTKHAKFRDFIYKPATILAYLRNSLLHKAKRYLGHNPAGGAMIIALLLSLTIATASGIAMTTAMFWGVEWIEDIHEVTANISLVLVGLHLVGVIFSSISHRENLVKSMITGFKRR